MNKQKMPVKLTLRFEVQQKGMDNFQSMCCTNEVFYGNIQDD